MKNILEQSKPAPRLLYRAAPEMDNDERTEDADKRERILTNIPKACRGYPMRAAPCPNPDAYKYSSTNPM